MRARETTLRVSNPNPLASSPSSVLDQSLISSSHSVTNTVPLSPPSVTPASVSAGVWTQMVRKSPTHVLDLKAHLCVSPTSRTKPWVHAELRFEWSPVYLLRYKPGSDTGPCGANATARHQTCGSRSSPSICPERQNPSCSFGWIQHEERGGQTSAARPCEANTTVVLQTGQAGFKSIYEEYIGSVLVCTSVLLWIQTFKLFFSKIMFSDDTFTLKTMWLFGETTTKYYKFCS